MSLKFNSNQSMTKKIPEVLYPLFWVDEHFEIDKKNADKFYYQVKVPLSLINIGKYVLFSFGALLLLVCCSISYTAWKKNKAEPVNNLINSDASEQTPLISNI